MFVFKLHKHSSYIRIRAVSLLIILFASCVSEEKGSDPIPKPPFIDEPRSLTLTIQIPGTNVPTTYALETDDENAIKTVDVLVFKVKSEGEFFHEHIAVNEIINFGSVSNVKQFNITLKDFPVRLVVLANARNLFTTEFASRLTDAADLGNVVKNDLFKYMVFDFSEPWNTGQINGGAILPFLMYGESDIIPESATEISDIKMRRSLCRIDIGVDIMNTSVNGFGHYFMIDSVYIFNVKDKGSVAPLFNIDGAIIERPNVPSGASPNKKYFAYKYEENNEKGLSIMERCIYITEDNQTSTPTVLVIKARYKDNDARYYRIDLRDNEGRLLPFLRNYRYRINISGMSGEGYLSAEEASAATPTLNSSIDTNELELRVIEFNDYYMLGLTTDNIVFKGDGSWEGKGSEDTYYSLDIYTTYTGWSVTWKDNNFPGWLEWLDENNKMVTDQETHFPSTVTSLKIKVNRFNTYSESRSAKLIIRAGTLFREVTIIQQSN